MYNKKKRKWRLLGCFLDLFFVNCIVYVKTKN
jgi:hypothetical protein